jgi:hypothetical protein
VELDLPVWLWLAGGVLAGAVVEAYVLLRYGHCLAYEAAEPFDAAWLEHRRIGQPSPVSPPCAVSDRGYPAARRPSD